MSDIFISYASVDRERAKVVAEALTARGLSVWWDRNIPPGRQFDEVIEEALDAARCVVVLWSQASTASTWVKTEAAEAMRGKALVPAIIEDGVRIPLEFRRLQAADLSKWRGDPSDPQLLQFFESIEAEFKRTRQGVAAPAANDDVPAVEPPKRIEPTPAPAPPPPVSRVDRGAPKTSSKLSPTVIGIIAAVVVVLVGAGLYYERGRSIAAAEQAARDKVAAEQAEREREQAARAAAQRKVEDEQKARAASAPVQRAAPAPVQRAAPAPPQRQVPTQAPTQVQPQGVPAAGVLNLNWRDSALGFNGALTWSPSSAVIRASVTDLRTGTHIGNYAVPALINQQGPMDYVVSAEFAVPGDSTTPGPHTHSSRLLVRAQQDGSLRLLQNCPRPGECY